MSDHIMKSYQEGKGTSMRPYHSVWLAHWSRPGCKSANGACNNLLTSGESDEESSQTKKRPLLEGPMATTITANHDIGSGEVAGVRADNTNKMTERSKKCRKERLDSEPFSMINDSQHRGGKLALKIEQATASRGGALKFHTGSKSEHKTSSLDGKGSQWLSLLAVVPERGKPKKEQIKSKDTHQHEDPSKFLNNNAPTVSPFVGDETVASASNFVPYEMSNLFPFSTCEQSINNEPNSCLASKKQVENTNFHTYSTLFVQETKINQLLDTTQATNALSRQHMRTFLLHNPSSSNLDQPNPYPIQCDTRKNSSNALPFQSQDNHSDTALPEYLYHGGYSMQRLPFSVHDVETMRICTTVDSVGQALRGPPKFCQTTHRLMITKKTDVDLYEGQAFRGKVASTNLKEETARALLGSSTNLGRDDQKENEDLGNTRSATSLSNESSSETDIMDMDAYQDNHSRDVDTSEADKELRSSKSPLLSVSATGSVRKQIGGPLPKKRLLNINERPPNRSTSTSLMENGESSTSKTQTLDAEHLLSNAEQQRFLNSIVPPDDSSKREIDSGWVKRLRPCASESVHDSKSTKKVEESSCDKANQLFNKMKRSSTSSDRSRGPLHGQEQLAVGQTATIVKASDLCSNLRLKNREMILSSPWIRRLCHNRSTSSERNLETAVVHKSQCSRPILNKPMPSIAAMALMGKTVTGLQPCEFIRRGSSLVWNTEGI
ncbi:F-box protein At2g16365-like [Cucurbita maxima]|uniref:F-box protein At2g16365-like n=1 Tax=Cucurbita maxima TaxID=3661 RepID=A0A6J1L1E3_CUCMA|nr:F-box protein At2g16365-like [Cucurbita maxima]